MRPQDPAPRPQHRYTRVVRPARPSLVDLVFSRPEPRFGLAVGIVVAVVLHILVVPGSGLIPDVGVRALPRAPASTMRPMRDREVRVQLSIDPPKEQKKEETPDDDDPMPRGQVVNLPAREVKRPKAADYVAETDQATDRETRARVTGLTPTPTRRPAIEMPKTEVKDTERVGTAETSTPTTALTDPESGGQVGDGDAVDGDAIRGDSRIPGGAPRTAMLLPDKLRRPGLKLDGDGAVVVPRPEAGAEGNAKALRMAMAMIAPLQAPLGSGGLGAGFGRVGGTGGDDFLGRRAGQTASDAARLSGLPRADHLLVEEDDETSLNTWRFKHATFFNRVADGVRQVWAGGEILGMVDPRGNIYGVEDRRSLIQMTLDREGNLVDVAIREPSGVPALDDEAIRAIREAAPFLNPPSALFRDGDRISFSFGFTVNLNHRSFDLNWSPY